MKVNKIPDKIYLYPYSTDGIYEVETKPLEVTIEYIRKDAFVEKACEWIKENLLKHIYVYEEKIGIGMGAFLKEFKQAMKGE